MQSGPQTLIWYVFTPGFFAFRFFVLPKLYESYLQKNQK